MVPHIEYNNTNTNTHPLTYKKWILFTKRQTHWPTKKSLHFFFAEQLPSQPDKHHNNGDDEDHQRSQATGHNDRWYTKPTYGNESAKDIISLSLTRCLSIKVKRGSVPPLTNRTFRFFCSAAFAYRVCVSSAFSVVYMCVWLRAIGSVSHSVCGWQAFMCLTIGIVDKCPE